MKRTMVEILFGGAVAVLLLGFHSDLQDLRKTESQREAKIKAMKGVVEQAQASLDHALPQRVAHQSDKIEEVSTRLSRLYKELSEIQSRFDNQTREAITQAKEANSENHDLKVAVETTKSYVSRQTSDLYRQSKNLKTRINETEELLDEVLTAVNRDPKGMSRKMLQPCVQLQGEETVGSGTLISSTKDKKNKSGKGYTTYVLTAYHVVRNILAAEPTRARKGIDCVIYTPTGKVIRKCDVAMSNPKADLALVKLRGGDRIPVVAKLSTRQELAQIRVWTPVYAIGCPLGNDPIPTAGSVSSLNNKVGETNYWMINAPTYFGNSGGGIYNGQTYKLLAVFSKIYTHGNTRPVVITHMGLGVPLLKAYDWFDKEGYSFLIPDNDQSVPQPVFASPGR